MGWDIKRLSLDGPVVEWLKTALRGSHEDKQKFHDAAVARLTKQYANLQRKLDLTYDDRLEGRLTLEQYEARANASREEMAHVRAELARYENADRAYTEEGIALLELSGMALELYEEEDAPERRRLLDFLTLNTEFRDDHIVVTWKKPFDGLAESIDAAKAKGVAIDESSDAYQVWLRKAVRSRNWIGVDSRIDFRLQRSLKLHREPRERAPAVVRAKTSVLARALEWQAMIRQPGISNRAGLAAQLGVSRARITQGMAVLASPALVLEAVRRMEAAGTLLTERLWRRVSRMPLAEAVRALEATGSAYS